ncbi:MAG: S8 family serine peptidase [Bacilli bacterium]|jgi:hypothetical protein|nr:S8 family serine peptidase [Bacilli bacterium]
MIQLAERDKENVLRVIRILEQRDDILSAEPNYIVSIQSVEAAHPNDANLRYQWVRDNTRIDANIQLEDAWDWSTGNATVLVGVIDTGIDGGHPDLTDRLQRDLCADFSTQNLGTLWGLLPSTIMTPNPTDNRGHGTRVAGIIGAQGVNNGVAGVNQNIRLVSLRVFNDAGNTTTAILNCAIDYAQDNNIPIINYSIGGYSAANSTRTAISNYSGFFVCSTGNTGGDNDVTHHYPSYYANKPGDALQNMIAVGRIDNVDERPADSNYGATTVNIFAPGEDILSTSPGGYLSRSGSSYATPHVTGVAALMRAMRPNMTPSQMRTALIDSAETISINIPDGSGGTITQDVRRLNALRALQSAAFTTSISGNNCTITGFASGVIIPSNLVIPENLNGRTVTQIGNSAFENQTQLTQISIPASVTSIGSNAFLNCTALEKVVIQRDIGNITNLGYNAFLGCSLLETIEVPTKSILEYISANNWSYYSDFMHYIEPITDGLTIDSVGGKSQSYLFQIDETRYYNFYHNCDNPIEVTIFDDENSVLLTNTTWDGDPIFIELEEDELYKIVIDTTDDEYFSMPIDEINETELELGIKYYETLNSYSYAYYTFTTPDEQSTISYTINSTIVGARTNMWLYNGFDNLITYDIGDINRNGAKIDYYLTPDTTYTVLLYLTSYYYYDDYTIQFYETNEEVYHLDWGGISKQYFDPLTYDYVNFIVFSYCYDLVFDEVNKTITFGMIECFWDITFDGYPNCPEEYVIGMLIGLTYNSCDNTLPFFSMNGFYEYQAPLPYTYSYSATVTDVSITFSDIEWASFVTQGPRV